MYSIPSVFHRHLRKVSALLMILLFISYVKLRFLSDPADIDEKKGSVVLYKPSSLINKTFRYTRRPSPAPSSSPSPIPTQRPTPKPSNQPTPRPTVRQKDKSDNSSAVNDQVVETAIQETTIQNQFDPIGSRQDFVEEHCSVELAQWIPDKPDFRWQKRAPYVIIAGALEAGVPSLTKRLLQHPSFLENRETYQHFFLYKNFRYFLTLPGKPKIWSARQHLYAKGYRAKDLKRNSSLHVLDSATSYLFWSDDTPRHVYCTVPWAKIIVLLRNPVDRLFAQYQSAWNLGLRLDLATWIQQDWDFLKESGVGGPMSDLDAWKLYLAGAKGEAPVGRGLYAPQLQQWLSVVPLDQILVMSYEDWRLHPQTVWQRVLDFLGMDDSDLVSLPEPAEPSAALGKLFEDYRQERRLLQRFYKQYNEKVYKMLDWQRIWD